MNEPCSEKCRENMICDFCSRFIRDKDSIEYGKCNITKKEKVLYAECDCDNFRCFTLDKKKGDD